MRSVSILTYNSSYSYLITQLDMIQIIAYITSLILTLNISVLLPHTLKSDYGLDIMYTLLRKV